MNIVLYKELLAELDRQTGHGLYRKFLNTNEIHACNQMVKLGYMYKSYPAEKGATIAFFITKEGQNYLES